MLKNQSNSSSTFSKNVITLVTGTTLGQAIPIAFSPILTRIYSPADFGVLALFISVVTILGSIISGKYENAIILPENEKEAKKIATICIGISFVISAILFLIILISNDYLCYLVGDFSISDWLYFIPIVTFLIGLFNTLNFYATRHKKFNFIAQNHVSKSLSLVIGQIFLSYLKSGFFGLIAGRILSYIIAPFHLMVKLKYDFYHKLNYFDIKLLTKKYINFPKFEMFATLFANSAIYFNNLLIPVFFTTTNLGFFSLVVKVLTAPFTLIGHSVGQVFFKEANEQKEKNGNSYLLVRSLIIKMSLFSIPSFLAFYFVAEDAFEIIFGEEWRTAGLYAKFLAPMYCLKFIVAPLTIIHSVYEKLKSSMFLQLIMFLISFCALVLVYYSKMSFLGFIKLYSISMCVFYLIRLIIIVQISKGKLV